MICPAKVTRKYDILVSDAVFMYYINHAVHRMIKILHKYILQIVFAPSGAAPISSPVFLTVAPSLETIFTGVP